MKKHLFTLLFAVWASVGIMFAESVILLNDRSVAEWDSLPSEYVFEATCPDSAYWTGVSKIKVYADDEYINYAVFYDSAKMTLHTSNDAFQIFLNADNSDQTGGYYAYYADAAVDLLLEGNLFDESGSAIPYSPAVYKWIGPEGGEPSSRTGDWSEVWNLLTYSITGESQIIDNKIIEGRIRVQDIAWRNWSDKFRIGFSLLQNWDPIGFLPQANSPDGERIGRTSQLEVAFAPSSSSPSSAAPSNSELAQYYDSGQVCVCIYVPDSMACNPIVLTGSFNGWSTTRGEYVNFVPVTDHEGWYVASFVPEDEPDAIKGVQVKPVMLDADGVFNWDYQPSAATIYRGDFSIVESSYSNELEFWHFGTASPNVMVIDAWKLNPCNLVYRNYTVEVINNGCDGLAVPYIVGSMTKWEFAVMEQDVTLTRKYGTPTYAYSFKATEGAQYQLMSALKDADGEIIEVPDWQLETSYLQKYVDGEWQRIPGDDGDNLITKSDTTILYDLRDTTLYRWARCAPEEEKPTEDPYYTIVLKDPKCEYNPEFTPALYINGDFVGFEQAFYETADEPFWMATVQATPGSPCHIIEMNHTFGNEIQYFDSTTQQWWGMHPTTFPLSADGGTQIEMVLDYSDTELYRYALCGKLGYDDSTLVQMNVKLSAPDGAPERVALVGNFASSSGNSWVDGVLMTYKNGFYTATVRATMNSQFTFKEYANDTNYIYYTNSSSLENFVFGEYMDDLGTVYVDLSDNSRYKWKVWSEYTPIEIYSITARADSSQNGTVSGSGEYKKGETAVIMATPRKDCTFEGWDDGNMLNPRSIIVTEDAVYTAILSRSVPLQPVITSDTMYFTAADTTLMAIRVYALNEIEAYDKLIIATVDNKNVMGGQKDNYREAVPYVANMNIENVSVIEVVPNDIWYRLRVMDGELAPRCENCTYALNQLYATETGADWYFVQNEKTILPEAAAYANRQILYNEESKRFSCYRQVSGLDRAQTTLFKLQAPRVIPAQPEEVQVDTTAMKEEEKPMEEISVEIESKDTAAVITTPYVEFVYSFTLIIWADESRTEVLMTITYDAEGQMISVSKPNALRRYVQQAAQISFEIGDLEPTKDYPYTLIACEDDGSILTSLNSSFTTSGGETNIQIVPDEQGSITKIVVNGQLYILRDGKWYNALGAQVQ